jgi:transposase
LYRHLDQTLDLSFVREFVQETYAQGGRPSIDPMVFFKLQLVMFFEGIRSERELMRQAAGPHKAEEMVIATGNSN